MTCPGYVKDVKFIQHDPGSGASGTITRQASLQQLGPSGANQVLVLATGFGTQSFESALNGAASQQQIMASFSEDLIPHRSGASPPGITRAPSLLWLLTAFNLHPRDDAVSNAMLAISTARAGRVGENFDLRQEALRRYGLSMQQVRRGLAQASDLDKESVLASVLLLADFEVNTALQYNFKAADALDSSMKVVAMDKERPRGWHTSGVPHS